MPKIKRRSLPLLSCLAVILATLSSVVRLPGALGIGELDDEVHSSYGDNASEMWVYWRGPEATVQYGETADYGQVVAAQSPSVAPVDTIGPFWQVKLTGLSPATTYHYRIGLSSPDYTFQTAPTADFVWDDIGDTGTTYYDPAGGAMCNKSWMPQVWQQLASEKPNFVTHGGDISYANECGQPAVHQFWNDIAPLATTTPIQFAWGNHEYGKPPTNAPAGTPQDSMANYKGRYNMSNAQVVPNDTTTQVSAPGCPSRLDPSSNACLGDDWGSFTVGHVLFISYPEVWLNAYSDWRSKAGLLMAQAETDPNIYFIVTYGHRPAYSSQATNGAQVDVKAAVNALGDQFSPAARPDGKYVLNVSHHVHGGEVFSPQHGVVNVTDGGGGSEEANITSASAGSVWHTNHIEHMQAVVTGHDMMLKFICGPIFGPNPTRDACNSGAVLYSQTLQGYQAPPPGARIVSTLSDGTATAKVGDILTYAATVQNTQPGTTASDVNLTLTTPPNVAIVDAGTGTVNDHSVDWSLGSIDGQQTVVETFVAQLQSGQPADSFTTTGIVQTSDSSCQGTGSTCTVADTDTISTTQTEYVTNPSVETTNAGWTGLYNSASKVTRIVGDAYTGTACLQIMRNSATAGPAGVVAKPAPVASTTAGRVYTGSMWTRAQQAGQKVTLVLKEVNPGGVVVGSRPATVTLLDTSWHQIQAVYAAVGNGDQLSFSAYSSNLNAGSWFHMDQMSLTAPN